MKMDYQEELKRTGADGIKFNIKPLVNPLAMDSFMVSSKCFNYCSNFYHILAQSDIYKSKSSNNFFLRVCSISQGYYLGLVVFCFLSKLLGMNAAEKGKHHLEKTHKRCTQARQSLFVMMQRTHQNEARCMESFNVIFLRITFMVSKKELFRWKVKRQIINISISFSHGIQNQKY